MTTQPRDFNSLSSCSLLSSPGGASFNMRRERSGSPGSRFEACGSSTTDVPKRTNFSSSSLTGYGWSSSYPKVSINKRLLAPLHLDIDPSLQEIRAKEKEEMQVLNNQFAALIGKVQNLEQHNQVLLTRWNFLKDQDNSLSDLDIKLLYEQYMNKLRQEIRSIETEKELLDSELDEVLEAMDSYRSKYEEEINKRTGMEFTFTTLKKDLDNGFLHRTELEAKLNGLLAVAELMKNIQAQELEEVLSEIKDVSIELGIDNNRFNIDPHRIVEDVRAQYEALALRSWEELEALTRSKLNEGEILSARYGDHLLSDRRVIAELNIQIQKLRSCILSLKSQCLHLEGSLDGVADQGETTLSDAKAKLAKLQEALHNSRQNLAHLVKEYQELMNVKLALDIEILTYRKLMEGEEISMESPPPAVISRIHSSQKFSSSQSRNTTTLESTTRAQEKIMNKRSNSGSSFESGLSRMQSSGSGGALGGDFPRSPSSRSGNLADIEDTMESNISRGRDDQGSGSFSQPDMYRSQIHSSEDQLEHCLSRSQSTRSRGLTPTPQEGSHSRSKSRRNVELSPISFSRTQSGESNRSPETALSRDDSYESRSISGGNLSRSQSERSGGLTDSVFARTHSGESVSQGSLSRSHSGTSASFVEGGLSRRQSDENETHDSFGSEECVVEPNVYRTNSAEDGGVPVGDISRNHSGGSRISSEGNLSRCRSDEKEIHSSHGNEEYVGPTICRTNSAEDGGVPVGGISRNHSWTSRNISEGVPSRSHSGIDASFVEGGLSRSQSEDNETHSSHGREEYAGPTVSRTNSAEDGGVPVGGISRSHSRASAESSLSRGQNDTNETHSSYRSEDFANPAVSTTNRAEDSAAVPVGSISKSSHGDDDSSTPSQGSFSRSQRGQSGGFADTVFTRARRESPQEGHLSRSGRSAPGSQDSASRGLSEGSILRLPSIRSAPLTDSVLFIGTPSSAGGQYVHEEVLSRAPSGAREKADDDKMSILEERLPAGCSHGSDSFSQPELSRLHISESEDFADSESGGHAGISESHLSRSQSNSSGALTDSEVSKGVQAHSPSVNDSHGNGGLADPHVARTDSAEIGGSASLSRTHSDDDESRGPMERETATPSRTEEDAVGQKQLSRPSSGGSGSFRAADFYRSPREAGRGVSDTDLARSCSNESEQHNNPDSDSGGSAAVLQPHPVSRPYSGESEDVAEVSLCGNPGCAMEGVSQPAPAAASDDGSDVGAVSRSEEAPVDNLGISHSSAGIWEADFSRRQSAESKGFGDGGLCRTPRPVCLIYEIRSDQYVPSPVGEPIDYVESSPRE